MAVKIFYDGDCPFCDRYVRYLRLNESAGSVQLENLRDCDDSRHELEAAGFDLDQGMVVELDGKRLGGADAVHALALLSTPSGLFNRLNRFFLSTSLASQLIYPLLRAGRWIVLFLLGRQGLAEQDQGTSARTIIFARFFALFSIFHFYNYALEYGRFPPGLDQLGLLLAAIALFFKPQSARLLWLLMLISTISAVVQAPASSNHTLVRNVVLVGYWLSFIVSWARGNSTQLIFRRFAVAGQGVLLVMYFFGIFHKLNTDFLNPLTSCAIALWQQMPVPLRLLDGALIDYSTIYGTLLIEGALIVLLLIPRLRHLGICGGILFHMLLALSGYAMYITFTMLSISLHALFLSGAAAQRILNSAEMQLIKNRVRDPIYCVALLVLLAMAALVAALGEYAMVTLLVLPVVLPFCWLVMRYGSPADSQVRADDKPRYRTVGLVTTCLLIANCMLPYMGLKTSQAINMFANLRLEAGVSNHLIMPVPGPFDYLENVAVIEDGGQDTVLQRYRNSGYAIVYYDLLSRMERMPGNTVSFTLNGQQYQDVNAEDLTADMEATLHSPWLRKWFHFQPVVLEQPERCNV